MNFQNMINFASKKSHKEINFRLFNNFTICKFEYFRILELKTLKDCKNICVIFKLSAYLLLNKYCIICRHYLFFLLSKFSILVNPIERGKDLQNNI